MAIQEFVSENQINHILKRNDPCDLTSMLSAVLVAQVGLAWWLKIAKPKKLPIAE